MDTKKRCISCGRLRKYLNKDGFCIFCANPNKASPFSKVVKPSKEEQFFIDKEIEKYDSEIKRVEKMRKKSKKTKFQFIQKIKNTDDKNEVLNSK